MDAPLPIVGLRASLLEALARSPVVVSSPTGSGKSTEVPRWCTGRVLVVEPRRVACQSLAARVSELERSRLGERVGFVVRDERVMSAATQIIFATPGIALRDAALFASAETVILDEFHERSMEVDLLLALLLRVRAGSEERKPNLIVMSATIEGERIAKHVEGTYLVAEGRTFPVEIRYLSQGDALPDGADIGTRVLSAVERAKTDPGDVLVFLPGKGEIEICRRALLPIAKTHTILPLHGGLSLDEQRQAFARTATRKVILATNVAETSLTIPGVGVVIDTGLVKETRYREGRASLVLSPIADDSAAQRAGRAGRMSAGVCYRLWSPSARLAPITLPEIHRESLVPLVMSAAAWGARPEDLRLLDAPKPYALEAARADLNAWGALSNDGTLSEGGRRLHSLPIDPAHARLLVEATTMGCLNEAIDLVSALSVGRPIFQSGPSDDDAEDLRRAGCDVTALVRAVRIGRPDTHRVSGFVVEEARRTRARLRLSLGLSVEKPVDGPFDRDTLLKAAIAADPRVVHVARARGRDVAFSNGGTELELARESAIRNLREVDALVVLDTRAFGAGKEARLLVTCASAISLAEVARSGLGRDRLGSVRLESGRVLAKVERVYAKRVIATRDEVPSGEVARAAIAELFLRGSLFRSSGALAATRDRLAVRKLSSSLAARGHKAGVAADRPILALDEWVAQRLVDLGVESGDDLALLSPIDLTADDLPFEARSMLDKEFPRSVDVGDACYEADYDLDAHQVTLRIVKGSRRDPPPISYLPRFTGLRVCVEGPRGFTVLRERR